VPFSHRSVKLLEQWQTQQQKQEEEQRKRETQGMADMMARMSAGA
jgi:hypothetical protein